MIAENNIFHYTPGRILMGAVDRQNLGGCLNGIDLA